MRSPRRWLGLMVVGVVLVRPAPAFTQNFIGAWLRASEVGVTEDGKGIVAQTLFTFDTNHTWTMKSIRWTGYDLKGKWHMSLDSLWLVDPKEDPDGNYRLKPIVQGEELSFDGYNGKTDCPRWGGAWKRVDPSKPLPAPDLTLPPLTVKPADLVGTWVPAKLSEGITADTLAFHPDSTWIRVAKVGDPKKTGIPSPTGKWALYAGDKLWLDTFGWSQGSNSPKAFFRWKKVTLKGQQLSLEAPDLPRCHNDPPNEPSVLTWSQETTTGRK